MHHSISTPSDWSWLIEWWTTPAHLFAVCCSELSLSFDCCCILLQNTECRIQLYSECCCCWREALSVYITIQTQFKYGCNSSTLFFTIEHFFCLFSFYCKKISSCCSLLITKIFFSTAKPKEWVNEQGKKGKKGWSVCSLLLPLLMMPIKMFWVLTTTITTTGPSVWLTTYESFARVKAKPIHTWAYSLYFFCLFSFRRACSAWLTVTAAAEDFFLGH